MKRYLYVLLLIMSALIVDVCAQTGPTYDDKTPPAFEWGNGKMNAQKQGTPTTNDHEIIANINVNVENTNEALGSLSIDLQKIDGRLTVTPDGATAPLSVSELIANNNESVGSISSYLNHTVGTETKSVAALLNEIANQDPNVTLGDISVDTSSIDTALANINSKLDDNLATITRGINTNIEGLRWTEFRYANSVKSEDDVATDTVVSLLREIKNKEAGEGSSVSADIDLSMIKAEDDVATDTVVSLLREIKSKETESGSVSVDLSSIKSESDTSSDTVVSLLRKANEGVVMDTVRYSDGSHGTGDTASVLFDGTLRAVPNFKIDAGSLTSPIKDKTERVFVEFKVPLATQTFFVGFKNDEKHLRPVSGRVLFEVGTQDLYIKIPSDSGIDYLWITEGWR